MKKKVFETALSSAVLYGCEAWLKVFLKSIETFYMAGVKTSLKSEDIHTQLDLFIRGRTSQQCRL